MEPADARLVAHVNWANRVQRCERVVIVLKDTDTFVLLLYYTPYPQDLWLHEMWQQYSTGEKGHRPVFPLHQAISQLGPSLAKTLIKAHLLTVDDCMSKVVSTHAAVACDPLQ